MIFAGASLVAVGAVTRDEETMFVGTSLLALATGSRLGAQRKPK